LQSGKPETILWGYRTGLMVQRNIIFLYLRQDSDLEEIDSTYPTDNYAIHCRPLLGLQYLVATARAAGATAELWDQRINNYSVSEVVEYVRKNPATFIGLYTAYTMERPVQEFIRNLRAAQIQMPIIVGGPGAVEYEPYLEAGGTAVCLGEGETVVKQLLAADDNIDWQQIPGLAYRNDDNIILTGPSVLITNLDQLPFPARNLPPVSAYRDFYLLGIRLPYATMMTGRGCPGCCSYCSSPVFWEHRVRQRSPENVVAEIDELVDSYGVRYIDMLDDVFGITPAWTESFCVLLQQRPYRIRFKILINPTTFGKQRSRMFQLLQASGCDTIGIGMQSAEPAILTMTGRARETAAELKAAVQAARQAGLLTFVSFIIGFPGEAPEVPRLTAQLLQEVRPHLADCYPLVFLPGTPLAKELAAGRLVEDYTYSERFQRAVRCKKQFYSSPRTLIDLVSWVGRHNPAWLLRMLPRLRFVLGVMWQ